MTGVIFLCPQVVLGKSDRRGIILQGSDWKQLLKIIKQLSTSEVIDLCKAKTWVLNDQNITKTVD